MEAFFPAQGCIKNTTIPCRRNFMTLYEVISFMPYIRKSACVD